MRNIFLIVATVLLTACASTPPKTYAFGARPMEPEEWFERLHDEMQECLNVRRSYGSIRWLLVPAGIMGPHGEVSGGGVAGMWSRSNRIYLDARTVFHGQTIRHEIGHYLRQEGDSLHDDPLFLFCISK